MHPALLTPAKQRRPSLTTVLAELKLRFAKAVISARRKPATRRNFKRIGLPSGVVSTAATIGVVHLDPSRQALHGVPLHHHLHEFVLDLPGRGLGNAKPAPQLDAGDASLALGEVVQRAGLDDAVMLPSADRANEAGWPAPTHHRLPALILRSVTSSKLSLTEASLKLDFVPCHRSNPQKQSNVRGLYSTLMAEDSP